MANNNQFNYLERGTQTHTGTQHKPCVRYSDTHRNTTYALSGAPRHTQEHKVNFDRGTQKTQEHNINLL